MRTNLLLTVLVVLLFTVAGCASNPNASDAAGQVLSGVLMGIGTGGGIRPLGGHTHGVR